MRVDNAVTAFGARHTLGGLLIPGVAGYLYAGIWRRKT